MLSIGLSITSATAAPVIDPLSSVNIPAGKSLIIPVTASSPNGRPLTFSATSSTNSIRVEVHTNNPFWKMSVVQVAPSDAPGAFQTPFRGGIATVTNIGDMTFLLFRDRAPRTVDAIQGLTSGGFYTSNTIFHRVVNTSISIIQGGDPATNGTGGPVFRYDDEFHPRSLFTGNGQLALPNAGKDSAGSQFFITVGPERDFDFRYTIFGQLLRGFNVLTNVLITPTGANNRPLSDVIITRASFVPNNFDTVITLTGTNLAGVAGVISVVADDAAGGRTTNSFTATTASDTNFIGPPFLYPTIITNLVAPMNGRLTNTFAALDLEGDPFYWFWNYGTNATNSFHSAANGQLQLVIVPNSNYVGNIALSTVVSPSSVWNLFPNLLPFDRQIYTLTFGDTPISATATNFVAQPLVIFSNQTVTTFTNGVVNSEASNFTARINWGDNSTNSGTILTNANGRKEVRGTHAYENSGNYPVYVTIQSALGAAATVVTTVTVQPDLSLARVETTNVIKWPAWAYDFQLQSTTNLNAGSWTTVTELSALAGYENVVTNTTATSNQFFRLKR